MQQGTLATGRQAARLDSILQRTPIARGSNRQCLTRLETSATSRKQTAAHDSNRHNRAASASPSPIFAPRFSLNAPREFVTQISYESSRKSASRQISNRNTTAFKNSCNELKTQHITFSNRNISPRVAIRNSRPPKLVRAPRCAPEFPHFRISVFRLTSLQIQRFASQEPRASAQRFFDPQQLVVLRDAMGARSRPRLDLPGSHGHHKIRQERVFGFTRTVRNDRRVSRFARHFYRFDRLAYGADLIP